MTFRPIGVVVMVSGPGDTSSEAGTVQQAIVEWNSQHAVSQGVVFVPKHYTSNVVPIYRKGTDGQAVINEQLTSGSDVVICLFKHRLGTPTPRNAESGTLEEADLIEAHGHVHVYFSTERLPQEILSDSDKLEQFQRLQEFRNGFHDDNSGLYGTFDSPTSLREHIDHALWNDAAAIKRTTTTPSPVAPATVAGELSVEVAGTVWRGRRHVERLVDLQIGKDVSEEQTWAASQSDEPGPDASISALLRPRANPGVIPRKPKSEARMRAWADSVRANIDVFDTAVAGSASTPIVVTLNSDALLDRVEVEMVFSDVQGVDPSDLSWKRIWTPLHQPAKSAFAHMAQTASMNIDSRLIGALRSSWSQDGNDLVLRLNLDELRNRRGGTRFTDAVILLAPSAAAAPSSIGYTWRASAAGVTDDWTGAGEVAIATEDQAKTDISAWLTKASSSR